MIHWGVLGWSNKRPGLEFYRYDESVIPRHGSEWGDLLAEELGDIEGSPVVVVTLDRRATKHDLIAMTNAIKSALDAADRKEEA